jgi:hypothetical protein
LAANTDAGTNAPVKTLAQTQSVPPANTVIQPQRVPAPTPTPSPANSTEGRPGGAPGVGAGEDSGQTASNTRRILNSFDNTRFVPKNNILDQYASYTYNIGWYLMPPAAVTALEQTKKFNLASYSLLMQSGGASSTPVAGITRNEFFQLDYYIDNLEIKSTITGKGSGRAHNAATISFTVTESTGITLLDNLFSAVKAAHPGIDVTYTGAQYCLVIRFYGYDENGKIVQANNGDNNNAVVEKIIPFNLTDITFAVGNKLVEYAVTAMPVAQFVGFGSNLGVIKAPIEIAGVTVKDLLMNGIPGAEISADDGRVSTSQPPIEPAVVGTNAVVDEYGSFTGESASPFQVGA